MPRRLLVLAGPDEGREFPLSPGETVLLGRSRATETKLIDPHVSRVHCQLQVEEDKAFIADFDSAGGTFVNGEKISERRELKAGDLIRIGSTRLQYFDDAAGEGVAPPPLAIPAKAVTAISWPNRLVGKKLSNYKVGPIMAQGKAGYVFHARDIRQNLPVALKVLDPAFVKNASAVQRFVRAMKTVLPLRHANLVRVYSAGRSGPCCWIAMEYVPGESLAAVIGRIETSGMLDWRHVLRFAIYITRALVYAHGKKIIHRNITPQNILLGKSPADTKLSDLMLARALEGENAQTVTRPGEVVGDLAYMAPERTLGEKAPLDGRADIYSLGATIYAMLTGHPPFSGETVTELVTKIRRELPVPLQSFSLGLPPELEAIVEKMMAKKPDDRFATVDDLMKALEEVAREKGVAV